MDKILKNALECINNDRDSILRLWEQIVNIDSGSSYKEGIDSIAVILKNLYDEIGFDTKIIENTNSGNTLIGETKYSTEKKGILFIGHMDTVFKENTVQERPFKILDGKAYGPGVLDMKGGLVIAYFAAKALIESGYVDRPIKIIFSGDEETGHKDSDKGQIFIDESQGYAAAFDFETGYMDHGIVVERKGSANYTLEMHGVSAHAGNEPENGRSAILEAAYKVIDIQGLTNYEEGTTYNVGVIKGGTVPNAVPDYVKLEIDIRFTDLSKSEEVHEKLQSIADKVYIQGVKSKLSGGVLFKPMIPTEGVMRLFEHYKNNAELLGYGVPYPKKSGGGSDAAYTVMANVPSICAVGVRGEWNHSPKEVADVESIFERAKLVIASVITLDKDLV